MANFQQKQPSSRAGVVHRIPYTTTAASTTSVAASTYQVRLAADGPCNVLIFSSTDATSTANSNVGFFLPANVVDYHTISPGQLLSVVSAASDGIVATNNGTLWAVEMS